MKKISNKAIAAGIYALLASTFVVAEEPNQTEFDSAIEKNYITNAQEPGSVMFNPPDGWHLANPKALPPSVKLMVVGSGNNDFPPSINLGTEKIEGDLKNYLKTIKSINDSQGSDWKDLGTIRTQAGTASLSQVDAKTEWGEVRMMHVILVKETTAYILTAAALKEEFPKFYKEFFKSMRSLRFNKNVYEMIANNNRRQTLESENSKLKNAWTNLYSKESTSAIGNQLDSLAQKVFSSDEFQAKYWSPFKELVSSDYQDMGKAWEKQLLNQVQNELFSSTKTDK